jgi:copper homeostasis protein
VDGRLDVELLDRLLFTARRGGARGLTLHRAIDLTPDLDEAIDAAAALGFDTVLSSGGAVTAIEGATRLGRMRQRAPASLTIMAGSGVTPQNVRALVAASGVSAVHASARGSTDAADPKLVAFGFAHAVERGTSATIVQAIREAIEPPPAR